VPEPLRISCVNKADRYDPHERIRNVGGFAADSRSWRLSVAEAIQEIERGAYAFYVEQPAGYRVAVVVAVSDAGHKYLKTASDRAQPNNLLGLPECA
jgi:hypothetical protein